MHRSPTVASQPRGAARAFSSRSRHPAQRPHPAARLAPRCAPGSVRVPSRQLHCYPSDLRKWIDRRSCHPSRAIHVPSHLRGPARRCAWRPSWPPGWPASPASLSANRSATWRRPRGGSRSKASARHRPLYLPWVRGTPKVSRVSASGCSRHSRWAPRSPAFPLRGWWLEKPHLLCGDHVCDGQPIDHDQPVPRLRPGDSPGAG